MARHILVISTSMREQANSELAADAFIAGVQEVGHDVKKITLRDYPMKFCKGHFNCMETGECTYESDPEDQVGRILDRMMESDTIVFATPIYFGEVCGQMITLLDRTKPLVSRDYSFREIYLLASSEEEEEDVMDGAVRTLGNWIKHFPRARVAGILHIGGLTGFKSDPSNPVFRQAFQMGLSA